MKNRILILEPYGSSFGHPVKNVDVFSDETLKGKYKFEFITDRGVRKQNIKNFFINAYRFYNLSIDERIKVRKREFKEIIYRVKNSHLLFSTTLEWDIEAWLELFKEGIEDNLKRRNNILTIHSGFGMYYSFLKHKKLLKEIELSSVRFTFFSELQTYLMKKSYPSLFFGTLPFPVYGINSDSGGGEKEFISYVGIFSIYKNPFFVLDLAKKLKKEEFFIHFYKIDETNYFLAREFFLLKNCKTNFNKLTKKAYKGIFQKSRFGILPYDRYEYSLRPSGIFEEFFYNGIPVFVPDGTWMGYTLRKYGLSETIYNGKFTDFVEKLKKVKRNELELKSKWKARAEKFRRELSLDNFFQNLKEIYLKMNKNISVHEKETIKRGLVNYYVNGAFYYFEKGDMDFSRKILSEIREEPEDYRDYYYIKRKVEGEKPDKISYYTFWSQPLDKNEFIKKSLYSSIFSEDIEKLRKELSSDENKKFLKNLKQVLNKSDYGEVFLIYFYYLTEVILKAKKISDLSSIRSKVNYFYKNNSKNISNKGMFYLAKTYYLLGCLDKSEKLFKSVLRRKINKSLKTESYLILSNLYVFKEKYEKAEYYHKKYTNKKDLMFKFYFSIAQKIELKEGKNHSFYYKKALNLLLSKNNKNETDYYRIGSLYKKIGNIGKAIKWFDKLLKESENYDLQGKAFFHLGEIEIKKGRIKKGIALLKKCLVKIPQHKKANEYILFYGEK